MADGGGDEENDQMEQEHRPGPGRGDGEDEGKQDQQGNLELEQQRMPAFAPSGKGDDEGQQIKSERDHPQKRHRRDVGGEMQGDAKQERRRHQGEE